ncbi:MAG TPA: quinol:electron acceptor oxidoreductase subunit ActD, partial [Planctomycetota bacterium]|nr:quinol:electron acceptor oxidoreductase subunit ActD [Planctomycetota bacterium]
MSATHDIDPGLHGVMAEYADEHALIAGIERAKADGFTDMEAYTPLPSHDVIHALGVKNRFSTVVFCGGFAGACTGLLLQYAVCV